MAFYWIAFQVATIRRGAPSVACITPHPVQSMYTIWKICMLLGLRIVPKSEGSSSVAIYWEDSTVSTPPDVPDLLNSRCVDIGKNIVEQRFAEVFGYPLAIDSLNNTGPYVRKSRLNAAHNGTIRNETMRAYEVDCVYERLVDNTIDEGWQVVDIRTAIVGTQIPIVFLLYRSISDRFGTDSLRCELVDADSVFTRSEQRLIIAMADAMGLDFGELDILRDVANDRIYVVDVNKTPVGPPGPLSLGERHRAMRRIASSFAVQFLGRNYKPPAPRVDLSTTVRR